MLKKQNFIEEQINRFKKKRLIKKKEKKKGRLNVLTDVPDCFYRKDADCGCNKNCKGKGDPCE